MTAPGGVRPGVDVRVPLTAGLVLGHAVGLLRLGSERVIGSALVFFLEPAIVTVLLANVGFTGPSGDSLVISAAVAAVVAFGLLVSLLTPVFFAGYLDEAIGREYFDGHRRSWREISRELPWGKLVVADIVLIIGIEIGLAALVIPAIIVCFCFALVGPVVVQERRAVADGFRRTYRISRRAARLVLFLVVTPILAEGLLTEALHELLHHAGLLAQLVSEWMLLVVLGIAIGLVEVALATELMRRYPAPVPLDQPG